MENFKVYNNIKISQNNWNTMDYFYQFLVFNSMSKMRGKESLECGRMQICTLNWAKLVCAIYGIFKLLFMHHLIFGLRWFS